jgi:hypothetical protein
MSHEGGQTYETVRKDELGWGWWLAHGLILVCGHDAEVACTRPLTGARHLR